MTGKYFNLLFLCALPLLASGSSLSPYESGRPFVPRNRIDELQLENLSKHAIMPARDCSDAVFLRRSFIDLAGKTPSLSETRSFLNDPDPEKRSKLIDKILDSEEFALYWTLKWGDILKIKSEFPINLWPNAVQAYNNLIWNAIRSEMPYDRFAELLLVSSGSNFRDPQINFYRASQDKSAKGLAKCAALTFMGTRLEKWPDEKRTDIEKFFSRVAFKKNDEWKEEILITNPELSGEISAKMPDGAKIQIEAGEDPRKDFAEWLIRGGGRKVFAQTAANRIWFWLFGRGIVHEADDFIPDESDWSESQSFFSGIFGSRPFSMSGNPPVNPELLNYLAEEFSQNGYDFKKILRLIANSATYQQSCIASIPDSALAEKYFAVYMMRRIDAEILADTLSDLAGERPQYMSVIPEPFTYVPKEARTIALNDGSISSSFLETFGRAARDSGLLSERSNEMTYSQRLFLLNSQVIHNKVCNPPELTTILKESEGNPEKIIGDIYLLTLSRPPSDEELWAVVDNFAEQVKAGTSPEAKNKKNENKKKADIKKRRFKDMKFACRQLIWTLINTKEFIYKR